MPPPLHAVGLSVAVLRSPPAHRARGRTVDVLHLLRGGLGSTKAGVDRDVGLGGDLAAQRQELVHADVVRLDALPRRVLARRPPVGIADAVLPVVAAHEVAPGPAVDGRVQLPEAGQGVGAPAVEIVPRHQRHGADPEGSLAVTHDLEAAVVGGSFGGEGEMNGRVILGQALDGHGVPVRRSSAPHEADADGRGRGRPGEDDAPHVAPALDEAEALLHEAGALRVSRDDRRVLSHPGPLAAHRHRFPRAEDHPGRPHQQLVGMAFAFPGGLARGEHGPGRGRAVDRVEELPNLRISAHSPP